MNIKNQTFNNVTISETNLYNFQSMESIFIENLTASNSLI